MINKWFWFSTDLTSEMWNMGRLGSLIIGKHLPNVLFVFSIQILMFHVYIGCFRSGLLSRRWVINFEHWSEWWKL